MSSVKRPRYTEIDGNKYALCFIPEIIRATTNYKPTSSDVFVATYPKCGTTWMIQIVILILRKGKLPKDFDEYFASSPFLDLLGPQVIKDMPGPGCLKTHLAFDLTPFSPDAKYIYVARHPRDCMISFYHHTRYFPGYYFTEGTFDDFFEVFITGELDFGDYFDHLLSWYEHRHEPNILFLTYEEMKADPRATILKVAKFLGDQYLHPLEEDEELLKEVMTKSSLEYMRDSTNAVWNEIVSHSRKVMNDPTLTEGMRMWGKVNAEALDAGEKSIGQFIGGGGKAKIQLSPEQERQLQERILEKTKDSDVMNLWKDIK